MRLDQSSITSGVHAPVGVAHGGGVHVVTRVHGGSLQVLVDDENDVEDVKDVVEVEDSVELGVGGGVVSSVVLDVLLGVGFVLDEEVVPGGSVKSDLVVDEP